MALETTMELYLDANGNVTRMNPVVIFHDNGSPPPDGLKFILVDVGNTWGFVGCQFNKDKHDIGGVNISGDRLTLTINEISNVTDNDMIEVTLFYELQNDSYVDGTCDISKPKGLGNRNPVKSFDPAIKNLN